MEVFGGLNLASSKAIEVEIVAPGVGKIPCLECEGDPEAYCAAYGPLREAVVPTGCRNCKNRGWVYVSA